MSHIYSDGNVMVCVGVLDVWFNYVATVNKWLVDLSLKMIPPNEHRFRLMLSITVDTQQTNQRRKKFSRKVPRWNFRNPKTGSPTLHSRLPARVTHRLSSLPRGQWSTLAHCKKVTVSRSNTWRPWYLNFYSTSNNLVQSNSFSH